MAFAQPELRPVANNCPPLACCRLPGGSWDSKSRHWRFPIAQHDRLVQILQARVCGREVLTVAISRCTMPIPTLPLTQCTPCSVLMQSLSSVRVRLEPLHPLVAAVLRVRKPGPGAA